MTSITYTSAKAELGRAFGEAIHAQARADGVLDAAGLPGAMYEDADRGSILLGRFEAIEGSPEEHFARLGGGDVAQGMRLSAAAWSHTRTFQDNFLVRDFDNLPAFQSLAAEDAARVIFCMAWADAMEEAGRSGELSGQRIENIAPETPPEYLEAGRYLVGLVEGMNKATVEELWERAMAAQFPDEAERDAFIGKEAEHHPRLSPKRFAECLAFEAAGTGVAWTDDAAEFDIRIPNVEFALDPIELSPTEPRP